MKLEKLRILLVEDDDDHAEIIEETARRNRGFISRWVRATTLRNARSRFEQERFDLVLLDLGLPDSPIDSTLATLPALGAECQSPIIVLTSLDDQDVGRLASQAGAQDYLCKLRISPRRISDACLFAVERHRLGRELREAHEFLRLAGAGTFRLDAGGALSINDACLHLLGYDRSDLPDDEERWVSSKLHAEDHDRVAQTFEALKTGRTNRARDEFRLRRRDGSYRWFQGVAHRDRESVVGMIQDVDALKQEHHRLTTLIDSLPLGLMSLKCDQRRRDLTLTRTNPAMSDVLGVSLEGREGAALSTAIPSLHDADSAQRYQSVALEGGRFSQTLHLERPSGAPAIFDSVVYQSAADEVTVVFTDVTEQTLQRREVEELALRHALSLRASNIGVWDWDVDKDHLVWDEQMYRLHGVKAGEFGSTSRDALSTIHSDDQGRTKQLIEAALHGQGDYDTQYRVVWPTGEVRHLRAMGTVDRKGDGTRRRMVGVNWDVTQEHRRAVALERSNAELEQFASVASHDLQDPLRMITGFADRLGREHRTQLDARAQRHLNLIVDGARRMQQLIHDLLALARVNLEAGPPPLIDSANAVRLAIQNLQQSIDTSQARIQIGRLPAVHAEEKLMAQVFQNLISNAIKFRGEASPVVEIDALHEGSACTFRIRDNGVGFDTDQSERIFEVFKRGHTRLEYEGNGIGLAIVKKIIDLHGGQVWAQSLPGRGATFFFALPAQKPERASNKTPRLESSAPASGPS